MVNILNKIKSKFTGESDVEVLKNTSYCNRMKYMLITLRHKHKAKYIQIVGSRVHKKSITEQEMFFIKLGEHFKEPKDLLELNMKKEFLKDFPQHKLFVKKYCAS